MSGATDAVFGVNPDRPDHPDLWRISEVILRNDGKIEAATRRDDAWHEIIDPIVDVPSLMFMMNQRANRVIGPLRGREEVVFRGKILTLMMDAFVTGALYQAAGGHQEKEPS